MPYSAEISRVNPTCFLFLIDRSRSMLDPLGDGTGRNKAEGVVSAINHLLYTLVLRCVWGNAVLDRFHVGVLGYGATVGPATGGPLSEKDLVPISELARNPLRVEERTQRNADGSTQQVRSPVWLEPAGDGRTPMCAAVKRASMILAGFLADHPGCFPPIVINVTDGRPTDGNPLADAQRMRQLSSTDGQVLLFNLHLSETEGGRIEFPDNEAALPEDPYAKLLFRMSSPLPKPLWGAAQELGLSGGPATRGFVFNADLDSVVRALDIGTRVSLPNKK